MISGDTIVAIGEAFRMPFIMGGVAFTGERCGLVIRDLVSGDEAFRELLNVADDTEHSWRIDKGDIKRIVSQQYEIVAVVHSHPNAKRETMGWYGPSQIDLERASRHLSGVPGMVLAVYLPHADELVGYDGDGAMWRASLSATPLG